jgi:fucose 4-O-acetylase-like acetyltransferase
MTGPYGGFTEHEKVSVNSLMLFTAIATALGILALIGTRYSWIRATGRLMLLVVAPILLGIHLNYSWASSGPIRRLDASFVAGLVSSLASAIALWEFTCWLGRRQATKTEPKDSNRHN